MKDIKWWKLFIKVMTMPDRKDVIVMVNRDHTEEKRAKIMKSLFEKHYEK